MRLAIPISLLAVLWLLLSGIFTPLQLTFGALSCVFVAWLTLHLGLMDRDFVRTRTWIRLPRYLVWLSWEITKSNLHVARILLSREMPLQRQLVTVVPSQRSDFGVAIHANSITLTPGTLTMDAEDGRLLVHALSDAVANDIRDGEMDREVSRLEGTP